MSPRISANSSWVCSEPDCQNPVSTASTLRCRSCWAKSEHHRVGSASCAMDGCEALVKARGLCDRHYRRPSDVVHHKQKAQCQVCNVAIFDGATLCRAHYLAAKAIALPTCACGATLSTKKAEQCRNCWMRDHMAKTSRPTCRDCKEPISWQVGHKGNPAARCMACHANYRRSLPKKGCSIEGCEGAHKARGLCKNHYMSVNIRERRPWSGAKSYVATLPCCICGYDRMRSHVHRLKHQGGYEWGNCIPVCQRCHDEIISKITPEPVSGIENPGTVPADRLRPARTTANLAKLGNLPLQ